MIDMTTGLPIPPDIQVLNRQDVNADYKARARGSSLMIGRGVRQQNAMAVMQAVQSNPVGLQVVNWVNWFRDFFTLFDMDPNKLLNVGVIPMINQMAAQQGGPPSPESQFAGTSPGGGTELEPLEPTTMGAQDDREMGELS